MATTTIAVEAERACSPPGKHLVFGLGDEDFGAHIRAVQEIIGIQRVTRLPGTPDHVRGVINLRGRVIPVIDLRLKFGLPARADTDKTCIIVMNIESASGVSTVGVIVDTVTEVVDLTSEQLDLPPSLGAGAETEFIAAVGKIDKRVLIVLDVQSVFASVEVTQLGLLSEAMSTLDQAAGDRPKDAEGRG